MAQITRHPPYSTEQYEIRPARDNAEAMRFHYRSMLELGWDRSPADLATYMDHSHSRGMLQAFPRGSNDAVGQVSAVINDNSTGWVATFIVDKPFQGLRLGAALWDSMMTDFAAQKTSIVGLDAVPAQRGTYERRGFVSSKLGAIKLMTRPLALPFDAATSSDANFVEVHKVPAEVLAQYDLKYNGFLRPKMWENLLNRPDVVGYAEAKSESPQNVDDITALMLLRRCPGGIRLGALMASDASAADRLLGVLGKLATVEYIKKHSIERVGLSELSEAEILSSAHIVAEVWTGNPEAVGLFSKHGFKDGGEYYRMWLNGRATPAQSEGGSARAGLFASFDAAVG